jgi:hypothetical protein
VLSTTDLQAAFAAEIQGKTEPDCKGKIFRVREGKFLRANGAIVFQREYVPMKRLSCPGCAKCDWLVDDILESGFQVIEGGEPGDLVELKVTNVGTDWETGYVDSWDLEFVKVKI